MPLIERSLASLPAADAERFVRSLFAPNQRFARAFEQYWKVILGHSEHVARRETQAELAHAGDALIANLADPAIFTVGHLEANGYQPIGIFGYRALAAHPVGGKIAEAVATSALAARFGGRFGIAHCVGILDAHAGLEVLKTMFLSIARKAQAADHEQLFFFTSDHRLEGLYRRFGMEFPPELALRDSRHLVGLFDLTRRDGQRRVEEIAAALDRGASTHAIHAIRQAA